MTAAFSYDSGSGTLSDARIRRRNGNTRAMKATAATATARSDSSNRVHCNVLMSNEKSIHFQLTGKVAYQL